MLLTRLDLSNFLAYRKPYPIELEDIGLACLSGPNGAGKSSLLDAVTWGLWGRARAKTDDELIHTGQNEMSVTVEFLQDGKRYRVERRRKRSGSSKLTLYGHDGEQWNQLFDGVRETQARLKDLLHLDYETFINSAYLQQGKADSFTVMVPSERKKILRDILQLERWDKFEKVAKDKAAEITESIRLIDASILHLSQEIAHEGEHLAALSTATDRHAQAAHAHAEARAAYEAVRGAGDRFQETTARIEEAYRRRRTYENDLRILEASMARKQKQIDEFADLDERGGDIDQGYAAYQNALAADDEFRKRAGHYDKLEKKRDKLIDQVERTAEKLEHSAETLRKSIQKAEKEAAKLPEIVESIRLKNEKVAALTERRDHREALVIQRDELNLARARFDSDVVRLTEENKSLRRRYGSLLEGTDKPECPVCGQPLDEDHRQHLRGQFEETGRQNNVQIETFEAQLAEAARQSAQFERDILAISREVKGIETFQAELGALTAKREAVQEFETAALRDRNELGALESQIAAGDYAHDLREQIAELQVQIDQLGYDRGEHEQAQDSLRELRGYEKYKEQLELARAQLPALRDELAANIEQHARFQAEIATEIARIAEEEIRRKEYEGQVSVEMQRRAEANTAGKREVAAREEIIRAEQGLQAVKNARDWKLKKQADREQIAHELDTYRQLAAAFGANGVPAMIIEAAIPEIEAESNRLLSMISDGQMHVRFITQKENKSHNVIDALDIQISDALGSRDYSMYSGGEGFRVNFAVRVALSQYLAKRAGSQLKTLFIDEGFGSQDAFGRERLIEAINRISAEFELILVVTHIDELREAFQKHLRVSKRADGSVIELFYN